MFSAGRLAPERASYIPRLIFRLTLFPFIPQSPTISSSRLFITGAGFIPSGRPAALIDVTRFNRVRSRLSFHFLENPEDRYYFRKFTTGVII
jgi:hypothetical protein